MRALLAGMRFLTIVPLGAGHDDASHLGRSIPYFPVIGLLIGLVGAAAAHLLGNVAPPALAATLIVLVLASASGGLHLDGLSDTADGFLSARPRPRVLEIMRDSHVGVMGVLAIAFILLLKVTSLTSLDPAALWPTVLLMPVAGRCSLVLMLALLPYVRGNSGLGSLFSRRSALGWLPWALLCGALTGGWAGGATGLIAAGVAMASTLVFAVVCQRRIGGATGDTYGAACEISETAVAVTIAMMLHAPAVASPVHAEPMAAAAPPPQRIVSQTLGTDEILFAICPADRIAGIFPMSLDERYSHCVAEAKAIESRVCANVEQIIAADPDLVLLAHYAQPEAADQLRQLVAAPVVQLSTFDSLSDIRRNIREIGRLTVRQTEAEALVTAMDERIARAVETIPADAAPPRVVSWSMSGYVAGGGTLFDDVLRTVRARNLAAENGVQWFSRVGVERIAAWDPDIILCSAETDDAAEAMRTQLLAQPVLTATRAGRAGRVIVLSDKQMLTVSHHIAELVESLVARLYPAPSGNEVQP